MKRCNNKGMTMFEILVAFVMLTLVMLIMYGCMRFASNILRESADIDRDNALFQEAVAQTFKDENSYRLGTGASVTYRFEGYDDKGNPLGPINYNINTASVTFKRIDTGYVIDGAATEDIRNIFLFSTGD